MVPTAVPVRHSPGIGMRVVEVDRSHTPLP
jgi:hypothetical protein